MMRLIAERIVKKAIDEGKFDCLAGRGMPLQQIESPFEDPSWCLSFHILRNAGIRPCWLEIDLEIRQKLQETLKDLTNTVSMYGADCAVWERGVERFNERIEEINDLIQKLNLKVPHPRFQRTLVNPEKETRKVLENSHMVEI
jgi:hypothetical protein